jgi:hypothetical protein
MWNSLMNAIVTRMSWPVASTAARPKRHSKRMARYTRVISDPSMIAIRAPRDSSLPTRAPTASVRTTRTPFAVYFCTRAAWMRRPTLSAPASAAAGRPLRAHRVLGRRSVLLDLRPLCHATDDASQLGRVRGLLELELHQRAARELDAVVDPAGDRERSEAERDERDRGDGGVTPPLDEVEGRVVEDAQHVGASRGQMLRAVWVRGLRAIQIRKNVRVTKIAVNSDAAMPAMSVTAKPRTGPVPYW